MIPETAAIPEISLTEALFGLRSHAGLAVVEAGSGRGLTYPELAAEIWSAASGLVAEGFGRGDVVAVHMPDVPELVVALHAVIAAGAAVTPVRPATTVEAMARQLVQTGAKAVVTWPVLVDIALEAVKQTSVDRVFCFGSEPDVESFPVVTERKATGARPRVEPRTDPALLPYTRGGRGVRLTHRNAVAGFRQFAETGVISGTDTVLSGIPLTEVIGLSGALHPALRAGAVTVTRPGSGRHDLLKTLQDHQVTVALLTPGQVETLAFDQSVGGYHLRALRSVICTGGPLAPETARACAVRMRCPVRQAYGLTESAGLTHVNLRAAQEGTLDSAGTALPLVHWKVVDPATGTDMPAYQPGEVWLRGPMVSHAYVVDGTYVRIPEWLPTGDAAFADEHGRLYVMGRMAEHASEPPSDPQAVLAAHPAVVDAVVVPVPDPRLGLVARAFVVAAAGSDVTDTGLLAYVNRHVPAYQRIDSVHVVDVIPRSPSGRVLRRALIERSRLPFLEG